MKAVDAAVLHGLHKSGLLDGIPPSQVRRIATFVADELETQLPESAEGTAWARGIMAKGNERYSRERIDEIAGRVA